MPIAAISSADDPKMVNSSMLKRWREVVSTTRLIHGANVRDRQASAGFAQRSGDGLEEGVRLHVGAHDPPQGRDARVERGDFVRHLRDWNVHGGKRVAAEAAIVRVTDDADDLTRRLDEDRAHIGADQQAILERIALGPELLGHRLIDDDYARGGAGIVFGEIAAAQKRNFEGVEIAPRDGVVACSAGGGLLSFRASDDVKGQAEAALQGETAGGSSGAHAGNSFEPLGAVANDLRDTRRFSESGRR